MSIYSTFKPLGGLDSVTSISLMNNIDREIADKLEDFISVKDFGAKGDGNTDDTSSFKSAIDYISTNGGGKLYIPSGHYILSSSFTTDNGQNSIITIPTSTTQVRIEIIGDGAISAFGNIPTSGTIISCPTKNGTNTSSGVVPSVFGYGTGASDTTDTISWNLTYITIKDLSVMVEPNSNICPFDFSAISNAELYDVSVFVNEDSSSLVAPTSTTFSGIKLPFTGNYGIVKAKNVYVSGFYYGIEHCEHADIEALINYCVYALRIPMSYSHLAKYKVTTQYCSFSVKCDGLSSSTFGFANSIFGTLDIERDPNFAFSADFYINENCILNGTLFYNVAADPQSLYSVWGSGTFNVAVQNIAYHSLEVTSSTTVNPNGLFYPVIPNNLTGDITLTIRQGLVKGQRIRIYGYYAYNVTVTSIASTGSPVFYFPDNSHNYSYVIASGNGGPQYIELLWNGQDWFATTEGHLIVNNATDANNATAFGQFTGNAQNTFSPTVNSQEQNIYNCPITLYIQFTIPAGATASLRMGPNSGSLLDAWSQTVPSGGSSVETTGSIRIPSNWYYEVYTTSGVTLGQSLSVQI